MYALQVGGYANDAAPLTTCRTIDLCEEDCRRSKAQQTQPVQGRRSPPQKSHQAEDATSKQCNTADDDSDTSIAPETLRLRGMLQTPR